MRPRDSWLGAPSSQPPGNGRKAWADMLSDSDGENYGDYEPARASRVVSSPSGAQASSVDCRRPSAASSECATNGHAQEIQDWAAELGALALQLQEVVRRTPASLRQASQASRLRQQQEEQHTNLCAEATTLRKTLELATEEVEAAEARHEQFRKELVEASEAAVEAKASAEAFAASVAAQTRRSTGRDGPQARLRPCSLRLRLYEEQMDRLRPAEAAMREKADAEEMAAAAIETAAMARKAAAGSQYDGYELRLRRIIDETEKIETSNRDLAAEVAAQDAAKQLPALRARVVETAERNAYAEEECASLRVRVEAAQSEVASASSVGTSKVEVLRGRIVSLEEEMEALQQKIDAPVERKDDAANDEAMRERLFERNKALAQEVRSERESRDRGYREREAMSVEVSAARCSNQKYVADQIKLWDEKIAEKRAWILRVESNEFENAKATCVAEIEALEKEIKSASMDDAQGQNGKQNGTSANRSAFAEYSKKRLATEMKGTVSANGSFAAGVAGDD